MKKKLLKIMAISFCLIFMVEIPISAMTMKTNNDEERNFYEVTARFDSGYGDIFIKLHNDFSFVNTGSENINWDLALTAVVLSDRVYDGTASEEVMKELGYTYTDTTTLFGRTSSIAFHPISSMGYKHLILDNGEEKNIFAIVVRGTQDISVDWVTDLYDGSITMFDASRGNVVADFKKFVKKATGKSIEDLKTEDNYFFITGHSLGGATANALSVDSTINELVSGNKNKIHTYTFESPHTCINLWWVPVDSMSNAYNFKDNDDAITHIAPKMGATTYGKDKCFDVNMLDNSIFTEVFPYAKGRSVTEAPKAENYINPPFGHHDRGLDLIYIIQEGLASGLWERINVLNDRVEKKVTICMWEELGDELGTPLNPIASGEYNGNIYKVYDIGMTWYEAKDYCEAQKGHLVTITSQSEQDFIKTLLDRAKKNQYWIGMSCHNGNMEWITGEDYDYSNWDVGMPDHHSRGDGESEDFIQIFNVENPNFGGSMRFGWNDIYFDNTYPGEESFFSIDNVGFICEYENEQ